MAQEQRHTFPRTIGGVTPREAIQWQNIKDGVDLYGRSREATPSERFFAQLDLTLSTVNFHADISNDALATKEALAFPLRLNVYKQRQCRIKIKSNDESVFNCIKYGPDRIHQDIHKATVEVYFEYTRYDSALPRDPRNPFTVIKWKPKEKFQKELRLMFSYCHNYMFYNCDKFDDEADALDACMRLFRTF